MAFFEDTDQSLVNDGDRCIVRFNVSQNDGSVNLPRNAGGLMRLQGRHATFYNNVFYNTNAVMYIQQWYAGQKGRGDFYNNVFWCPKGFVSDANNDGPDNYGTDPSGRPVPPPFTYDHNLFYGAPGPSGGTAQIHADPKFVRPRRRPNGVCHGGRLQAPARFALSRSGSGCRR